MKKVQPQLPAMQAQGLPADLSELDKKYARAIRQPIIKAVSKLEIPFFILLDRDLGVLTDKVAKSANAALRGLATKARQLIHKLVFERILPGAGRIISEAEKAHR